MRRIHAWQPQVRRGVVSWVDSNGSAGRPSFFGWVGADDGRATRGANHPKVSRRRVGGRALNGDGDLANPTDGSIKAYAPRFTEVGTPRLALEEVARSGRGDRRLENVPVALGERGIDRHMGPACRCPLHVRTRSRRRSGEREKHLSKRVEHSRHASPSRPQQTGPTPAVANGRCARVAMSLAGSRERHSTKRTRRGALRNGRRNGRGVACGRTMLGCPIVTGGRDMPRSRRGSFAERARRSREPQGRRSSG